MNRLLATAAVAATLGAGAVATASTAHAAEDCTQHASTLTCAIKSGNDGQFVGQATFTRSVNADGTISVAVHGDVPDGISESHLCDQDTGPYTSRVSPGQCQLNQGSTGTTVDYRVTFPATDADKPVYFQFHLVTKGNTAFAGWRNDASPFYGNAEVDPAAATSVPVGTIGSVGLAGALGLGLAITIGRRRAASPAVAGR
jgi:hypothetical protein